MLDLHTLGEPVDALTLVEHLKQAGRPRRRRAAARRSTCCRLGPGRRQRPPVRAHRARQRDAPPAPARLVRDPGARPQPRGAPARARRHGGAGDPRGRPRGQPQGLPPDPRPPALRARQARAPLPRGQGDHRHRLGLRGPRHDHRRLPARQPDHPRRTPVDGKVRADGQLRRERGARAPSKAVALFSLEMSESELAQRFIASQASIKGDDLRKGKVPASRWPKILAGVEPAGRVAAVHRRLVGPLGARRPREGAAARAAERRRPRADPDRLPAADARERRDRQPRRADRPDLPRPQDARPRAPGPGHRALPAQPRRRAADRQAPGALGPSRVAAASPARRACTCPTPASTAASTRSSAMRDFRVLGAEHGDVEARAVPRDRTRSPPVASRCSSLRTRLGRAPARDGEPPLPHRRRLAPAR